jgi:hypothetical protein
MSKDILRGLMGFAFTGTVCAAVIVHPPAVGLLVRRLQPSRHFPGCLLDWTHAKLDWKRASRTEGGIDILRPTI